MPKHLIETSTRVPVTEAKSGRLSIGLISPGWGSSGYYSTKVLENAADDKVFPAGTQMFMDHPGESERYDRPERSVKDLAAVLTTDATWDGTRLVGEAQVFGPYRELLTDETFAGTIGTSIRATAEVTTGEAEGRKGQIITNLVESQSVDFVTKAGRGGSILAVLESVRPATVVGRAVAHGVAEATANDTREGLQNELRAANPGDKTYVWVRDFDDTRVWFDVDTADDLGTFEQTYTIADDGAVALTGTPIEVRPRTEYVPVLSQPTDVPAPAGQSTTTQESEEDTMPQIEEAELSQLRADAGRVLTIEAERASALAEVARYQARDAARPIVSGVVGESATLPAATAARVIESVLRDVPLTEAGALDEAALRSAAEAARTAAETEVAQIAESLGVGKVTGFGGSPVNATITEADATKAAAAAFGRTTKEA